MSEAKKKARRLWFRAKEYGWGWYPVTWEGWAVTTLFTLTFTLTLLSFIIWIGAAVEAQSGFNTVILGLFEFVAWMTFLIFGLFQVCSRTGEKPGWHWGAQKPKK